MSVFLQFLPALFRVLRSLPAVATAPAVAVAGLFFRAGRDALLVGIKAWSDLKKLAAKEKEIDLDYKQKRNGLDLAERREKLKKLRSKGSDPRRVGAGRPRALRRVA
jgi:hypothetical protein